MEESKKTSVFQYLKRNLPTYIKGNAAIRTEMQRHVEDLSLRYELENMYKSVPDVFNMIMTKDDPSARDLIIHKRKVGEDTQRV
jgi:hypothetical protein